MKNEGQEDIEFLCGMELLSKKGRDYIKSMIEIMLLYQKTGITSDKTITRGAAKGSLSKIP
jgi:hypothetical protein